MIVPPKDTKKLLARLTEQYHEKLASSPAEKYLLERGITKEAQNYFRLGFVSDPEPEERYFEGRLVIPYITGRSVVGLKYRLIDDKGNGAKYVSSVGFYTKRIFNPNILNSLHTKVYVCEGEIDAITLHQLKIPAIAIPGANNYNPVVGRALRNRRVIVLTDGDGKPGKGQEAGQNFGKVVLSSIDDGGIINMDGTDVNQYFLDNGPEELKRYIGWTS